MKKLILIAAASMMVLSVAAQNSQHAIGVRTAAGFEFMYKNYLNESNFIDVTFGDCCYWSVMATSTYNWNVAQFNWTPSAGQWSLYAGVGAGLGYTWADRYRVTVNDPIIGKYTGNDWMSGFVIGAVGQVGLQFNLKNGPWTFAVDYRPVFGVVIGNRWKNDTYETGTGASFYQNGLFNFGLSAQYRF